VQALWVRLAEIGPGVVLLYGALVTLLGHSEGLFEPGSERSPADEWIRLCKSVGWATFLLLAAVPFSAEGVVTPRTLIYAGIVNVAALYGRRAWGRQRTRQVGGSRNTRNVLIAGAGELGREVARHLESALDPPRVVKGFLDSNPRSDPRVLGTVEELAAVARAEFADEIIVALPHDRSQAQSAILEALRNRLDVYVIPDLFGYTPERRVVEPIGHLPLIPLHEEALPEAGLWLKRMFDMAFSLQALLLSGPLLGLIALLIKLDSPGPVLYHAVRVGKKGRQFLCCKFRTMVSDADAIKNFLRPRNEREGPIFKISNDPRITRIGRILRRYSLDELPQLWNVLAGEMSLVGPRPHPVDDYHRYELQHLRRLDVTPGITGLWQVTARKDPSFSRNMALDLEYIDRWSFWLDLRIMAKTVGVVIAGTGA
jgi:exopolysaccharide biosynthesis polyprenyl glycosylphosphotransferase